MGIDLSGGWVYVYNTVCLTNIFQFWLIDIITVFLNFRNIPQCS